MIIVGASGHAREILNCIDEQNNLFFFDDINEDLLLIANKFSVIKNFADVKNHFINEKKFILGIGNPHLRYKLANKFTELGGILNSVLAKTAIVSSNAVLGEGLNIMHFVFIAPEVKVGKGTLINTRVSLHHDVEIGEFCEISPGVIILGRSKIGNRVFIGAGAIVLPGIEISDFVVVGAGAVVTKNVSYGQVVVGVPAKPFKKL